MRKNLVLYLFIFSLLFTIFIYVNDKKILDSRDETIKELKSEVERLEFENDSLAEENEGTAYFSLLDNEDAMSYFENRGIEAATIAETIENELISQNKVDNDNAFVPFAGMEGSMRINKIKILNHKWIIADFTDGKYWGEVFFTYEVDEKGKLNLTAEKSFLYPVN
ncbi:MULTISPECIES: hypothetical protein [Salegentibacter]|uniref:Hydrolase n=1 Tax=Salegentibacter maritimus TaxID=2794347 RepID=A0ABS0TD26_9FLAO|nr:MULTISPECIES: hypothetical protein [Salegentibacter]MBE7638925.1 hypothetical protein [Salegentibacter sp. BLCTC]MBI6115264.1 hypothetical protein [Salegentibacter maritimus]MBI6118949.1 hypothetical protein [Salegentibacter maritimus]